MTYRIEHEAPLRNNKLNITEANHICIPMNCGRLYTDLDCYQLQHSKQTTIVHTLPHVASTIIHILINEVQLGFSRSRNLLGMLKSCGFQVSIIPYMQQGKSKILSRKSNHWLRFCWTMPRSKVCTTTNIVCFPMLDSVLSSTGLEETKISKLIGIFQIK
jgi:hypothetical protein